MPELSEPVAAITVLSTPTITWGFIPNSSTRPRMRSTMAWVANGFITTIMGTSRAWDVLEAQGPQSLGTPRISESVQKKGPEITSISGPGEFSLSGESYVSTLIGPRDLLKEHQK